MNEDRGKPNDWAAKHAAIDAAARTIIGQETAERDAKTARLRALREAQPDTQASLDEAADSSRPASRQKAKVATPKPLRRR